MPLPIVELVGASQSLGMCPAPIEEKLDMIESEDRDRGGEVNLSRCD